VVCWGTGSCGVAEGEEEGLEGVGGAGDSGADFKSAGHVFFETTRALREKEGFTVAVDWEKGIVTAPLSSPLGRVFDLIFGDRLFAAALWPLLVLLYFIPMWLWLGRSPSMGTVAPVFDPPEGIEPGLMALIRSMKFVPECFTSNLVQLAVLGYMKFDFEPDGGMKATKTPNPLESLPATNPIYLIRKKLFGSTDSVSLDARDSRLMEAYVDTTDHYKPYADNTWAFNDTRYKGAKLYKPNLVAGWSGVLLFAVCVWFLSDYYPFTGSLADMDGFLSFFVCFLIANLFLLPPGVRWLGNTRKNWFGIVRKFFFLVFGIIFAFSAIVIDIHLWNADAYLTTALFATWALFYLFFTKLMPARTKEGVELLRETEGLAMYVNAEKEYLAQITAPEDTAERYERILPYAIALGAAKKMDRQVQAGSGKI
jgi:hypothetical protein